MLVDHVTEEDGKRKKDVGGEWNGRGRKEEEGRRRTSGTSEGGERQCSFERGINQLCDNPSSFSASV